MTLLLKDPAALLDYAVDWGADYLGDDTVSASVWSVDPDEPGGVTVAASEAALTTTSVIVAGGIAGRIYRLVNHVTLLSGREDQRSISLRVEPR